MVQPHWLRIPNVQVAILRRILAVIAKQELPVSFNAPEVLQRAVRIFWRHVMYRVRDAENRFAICSGILIQEVDTWQVGWGLETYGGGNRGEDIDGMGKVWDAWRLRLTRP